MKYVVYILLHFKYVLEILDILKSKIDFKDVEITIEVNPGTVNKEKLIAYSLKSLPKGAYVISTQKNKIKVINK